MRGLLGRTAVLVLAAAVPAATREGRAAEWQLSPRLGQDAFYDDNVGFTTDDEQASLGSTSTFGARLTGRGRAFDLDLNGRVDLVRYFEESTLNTDNEYLTLNARQRFSRSEFAVLGSVVRDVSREDEITGTGNRDLNNERQETYDFQPSVTYQLTPSQTASFGAGIRRRAYPNVDGAAGDGLASGRSLVLDSGGTRTTLASDVDVDRSAQLQNFTEYNLDLSWTEAVTSRIVGGFGVSGLLSDQARQNLQLISLQGVANWQVTPRLSLSVRAGPSVSRIETRTQEVSTLSETSLGNGSSLQLLEFDKGDDTEVKLGYVVNSNLSWTITPRTTARATYTRSTSPSSTQGVVTRDQLGLDATHQILRRLRLVAAASAFQQDSVTSQGSGSDRKGLRFEPGITWQALEDVDLTLRYRLRYEEFGGDGGTARSNAVFLRVDLRLPELLTHW